MKTSPKAKPQVGEIEKLVKLKSCKGR